MRLIRPVLVALFVVAVGVGAVIPAAAATPVNYVALGDSYSSGLGAGGSYSGGSCDRSTKGYPALWAAAHSPASFASVACAGATTATVQSSQVPSLATSTTLVSITVGGNDVGFSSVMTTCVLKGTSSCVSAIQAAENTSNNVLPARLDALFGSIRAAAPSAKVVVLDYPVFYQLGVWYCIGLSSTSRAKLDEGINVLDGVLQSAAGRAGFTFADVRNAFVGHQLCSGSGWLHALDLTDLSESYHPTATGQAKGYLPVFAAAAG